MAGEFTLLGFAALATELIVEVDKHKREALEDACKIIEKESKRVIGTYDYGWRELAESTQAERERQGFSADEPLLRTGKLRDSIKHTVISDKEAAVGSNEDIAVYQELGTSRIPPRSFLAQAAVHTEKEVAHAVGHVVVKALLPAGMLVPEPKLEP
jgi:HK97 gp10 family phage protein